MSIRRSHVLDLVQVLAVVAVLATALFLSGQLRARERQASADAGIRAAPVVSLVTDDRLVHIPVISTTGTVVSRTSTQVAARVSGQVVAVSDNFRPGANVRSGEMLFSIDRDDYLLAVERARARIASDRASLARVEAEADSARQEWAQLYPGRPITPLAAMEPQLSAARAQLSGALAAFRTAELSLERTQVIASVDAHVVSTELDVGQIVSPGVSVGVLQPVDAIEVEASLSVSDIASLSPLDNRVCRVRFRGRVAGSDKSGRVVRVAPRLDRLTRLAQVYIVLDDRRGVRVGEFADIDIFGEPVGDAVRLPPTSLSGASDVWIVDQGVLVARQVRVLQRDPELIVAPFDIADGVVLIPPFGAYDGMQIEILDRRSDDIPDVAGR